MTRRRTPNDLPAGTRVPPKTWTVHATVVRVVDGDTFECNLDLGWRTWLFGERVRVAAMNCPELDTAAGTTALARARQLLPAGANVTIISHSRDKYGRVLANVLLPDFRDYAGVMLAEGHSVPYDS